LTEVGNTPPVAVAFRTEGGKTGSGELLRQWQNSIELSIHYCARAAPATAAVAALAASVAANVADTRANAVAVATSGLGDALAFVSGLEARIAAVDAARMAWRAADCVAW
jgi:hypothetical protein